MPPRARWRRCSRPLPAPSRRGRREADPPRPTPVCSLAISTATAPAVTPTGLTEAEAARRLKERGVRQRESSSRSYASIIRGNTLNIPNGILFFFGVLTLTFGSWKDALFVGILVLNIAIGSFQEIRSKRALDRLAALVAPEA